MSLSCSKTSHFPLCSEYNPTPSHNLQGSSPSAAFPTTSSLLPTFPWATSAQPPVPWIPKLLPTSGPLHMIFSARNALLWQHLLKFHLLIIQSKTALYTSCPSTCFPFSLWCWSPPGGGFAWLPTCPSNMSGAHKTLSRCLLNEQRNFPYPGLGVKKA